MKDRELLEKELGREEIIKKNRLANELINEIEQEILTSEDFSPEVAASLAGRLLAYYAEAVLHNIDRITVEWQADIIEFGEVISGYDVERKNLVRLEVESALISASREGDYVGIKAIIKRWANVLPRHHRSIKFLQLISCIPDKGEPFVLPPPAWIAKQLEIDTSF